MFVTLGAEDPLSDSVARRLVGEYAPSAQVVQTIGLRGNRYLRRRMRDFNQIATHYGPVLVLTDLDRPQSCPPKLVRDWIGSMSPSPDLLVRVAVLEIESWIMADRIGLAEWLGLASNIVIRQPDDVLDPKRELTALARRSHIRSLRSGLVRESRDGSFTPGPDYNAQVGGFASSRWNPEAARRNSPSLDRAIRRIADIGRRQ